MRPSPLVFPWASLAETLGQNLILLRVHLVRHPNRFPPRLTTLATPEYQTDLRKAPKDLVSLVVCRQSSTLKTMATRCLPHPEAVVM